MEKCNEEAQVLVMKEEETWASFPIFSGSAMLTPWSIRTLHVNLYACIEKKKLVVTTVKGQQMSPTNKSTKQK